MDGAGLFGKCFGPGLIFRRGGFLGGGVRHGLTYVERGLFLAGGVLEIGAEPADDAAAFFFGPFVVEGHEPGEPTTVYSCHVLFWRSQK